MSAAMESTASEYRQNRFTIKAVISVATGEVWATAQKIILKSDSIGSCGVVASYDPRKRIGALAHIMLPGSSSACRLGYNTKYARDAIDDMIYKMARLGADKGHLEACLVGAGNVLNDKDDTLCRDIIDSITGLLKENAITMVAQAVGGTIRRSAFLDIENGALYYTEGDGQTRPLYAWREEEPPL